MNDSTEPRWVPIAALPLDLLVELRDRRRWRRCEPPPAQRPPDLGWLHGMGIITLLVALIVAWQVADSPGFAWPWRFALLALGLLVVAWWLLFRPGVVPFDEQQWCVGATTLVLVDPWSVRIFPAEKVVAGLDQLCFGDELICVHGHPEDWIVHLREAIERAQDPVERAVDRWRSVAHRAGGASRTGWSPREAALIGVAAVAAAMALESGPLHRRALGRIAEQNEAQERVRLAERLSREAVETQARNEREERERRESARRGERARNRREALEGRLGAIRAYLSDAEEESPEAVSEIRARHVAVCEAAFPLTPPRVRRRGQMDPTQRALQDPLIRHLLRSSCLSVDSKLVFRNDAVSAVQAADRLAAELGRLSLATSASMQVTAVAWDGFNRVETVRFESNCQEEPVRRAGIRSVNRRCRWTPILVDESGDDRISSTESAFVLYSSTPDPGESNDPGGVGDEGAGNEGDEGVDRRGNPWTR